MALVIFDLDGTLIKSYHGLGKAMNSTLEDFGCPTYDYEKYMDFIGAGVSNLVYEALPADKKDLHEEALAKMYKNYEGCYDFGLEIYPRIDECLSELEKAGHKIAVATNKTHYLAVDIVERYFAKHSFEIILGANEVHKKKPDTYMLDRCMEVAGVSKDETFLVGDSNFDIEAANNAGIRSIFVSWGYRTWEQVRVNEPSFKVDDAMGIIDVVNGLRG